MKKPAGDGIDLGKDPLRVDTSPADGKDIGELAPELLAPLLVATNLELPPLATGTGEHQATAVKLADEMMEILEADFLWREFPALCSPYTTSYELRNPIGIDKLIIGIYNETTIDSRFS